jgi:hypothetical protein
MFLFLPLIFNQIKKTKKGKKKVILFLIKIKNKKVVKVVKVGYSRRKQNQINMI